MSFATKLPEIPGEPGQTPNPFAGRIGDTWVAGSTSIEFLEAKFGQYYPDAEACKAATNDAGLRRFFDWLKDQGILK